MKKTYNLTNDHYKNAWSNADDAYFCEFPNRRNEPQFRLCVDKLREIFPKFASAETLTVTVSTTRQHRAGEFAVRIVDDNGYLPTINVKRKTIALLNTVLKTVWWHLGSCKVYYVTIK